MGTITFTGNFGEIDVDASTGAVVTYRPMEGEPHEYADIVRVDLEERRRWYAQHGITLPAVQPNGDIVDVGLWTDEGEYIAAENDWRENTVLPNYRYAGNNHA